MDSNILNNKAEIDIARQVLQTSLQNGAEAARITLNTGFQHSFAVLDGKLDKLQMANDRSLYIQLYTKGRYGAYSTNRLEKNELEKFIRQALTATALLAKDPCRSLPNKDLYFNGDKKDLGQFDSHIFTLDPSLKKELAFQVYNEMEGQSKQLISANSAYEDYMDYQYMIDSQGFEGDTLQTGFSISAECSVKGRSDARPESWWYESALQFSELEKEGCGKRALERGLAKLSPRKIKSGTYRVVVENTCASRLVSPIISALSGENIQQKNSFILDKLGEKIFPDHFTFIDTPHQYGMSGARYFDGEGIATRPISIIEKGIINTYFINTYYANKMGVLPTIEGPSVPGFSSADYPASYQNVSLKQILKIIDTGIFVTGFNGGNCNGTTGDFSYGVEGFFIKNGEIEHPIREMNITGNLITLWNHFLFSGNDPRKCTRWQIPSLAFDAVDFTGL